MSETTIAPGAPIEGTQSTPGPLAGASQAPAQAAEGGERKDDGGLSDRLSAMARKEKQLYRLRREMQQREQSFAQREAQIKQFEQWREQGKQNPESFLQQSLGMTYDQFVQWKLNGGQVTPEMEVKAIREDLARRDQEQRTREQQAAEQQKLAAQREADETVATWKQQVADFLESAPDDYELTLKTQSQDLVTDTVEEHWKRSVAAWKRAGSPKNRMPKLMSDKDAADLVEKYLEDQMDEINGTSKKLSSRWAKRDAGKDPERGSMREAARELRSSPSPTLAGQMPSTSAPSILSPANEGDRMARALAKLKGKA